MLQPGMHYAPHGPPYPPHPSSGGHGGPQVSKSPPEQIRRVIGTLLYVAGMLGGAALLFLFFFLFPALSGIGPELFEAMFVGAVLAFPMMIVYLTVPRLLDRYDPEPAYALVMALGWGAVAACGASVLVNSLVEEIIGGQVGSIVGTVVSAPLMEEASKGILVLGFFYFLRREFDGVVDGIIYATFVAIGFAAVENVIYYARAGLESGPDGVFGTFVIRGVLAPWGHPLYTSMTGIGVGLARETEKTWVRFTAPFLGYGAAVFLHCVWNASAVFLGGGGALGCLVFVFMLMLWLVFVMAFLVMVGLLVRRRGRIIRAHLIDEVALGHLSKPELELVASAFGGLTAYVRKGSAGVEFVRAVARLALSKWHTTRAIKGNTHTVSMEFIVPLRRRIGELRASGASPVLPKSR